MAPQIRWTALVTVALTLACGGQVGPKKAQDPNILAQYEGGALTRDDIDAAILELPPGQRLRPDLEPAVWFEKIARKLAFEKILIEAARLDGTDQTPAFLAAKRDIQRKIYVDYFIGQTLGEEPPITLEDVRAFYEANERLFQRKARRLAYHIFKRFRDGVGEEELVGQLLEIKKRVLEGESFPQLAEKHSDSESRHRKGSLGFIDQGQLSPELDVLLFSLEERAPSEPVVTKDGVHLFYTEHNLPAQSHEFEEVRLLIYRHLEAERGGKKLVELVAAIDPPSDSFIPEPTELAAIMKAGDVSAPLLRLGDYELSLGKFSQMLANQQVQGPQAFRTTPSLLFQRIKNREFIFQHMREQGLPDDEMLASRFERAVDQELYRRALRKKMVFHVEKDPLLLRDYYEHNHMRFSSQAEVRLVRLAKKIGPDAASIMARLEQAKQSLDHGSLDLISVAEELEMELEDLGLVNANQLAMKDPFAAKLAFSLKPGEHSFPYNTGAELVLLKVESKKEPQARPFSVVYDAVLNQYLASNSQIIYEAIAEEALAQAGFRFYKDRISEAVPEFPELNGEASQP